MTNNPAPATARAVRNGAALLAALLAVAAGLVAGSTSPVAAAPDAPPTGLTWKLSEHAFTSSSLQPAHATEAPATKTADGFSFPEATAASYDPETGIGQADFPGSFDLGNTAQGNYRIRIASPRLLLDGDGTGSLTADVSYALAPAPGETHTFSTPVRATVADLTFGEGSVVLEGDQLSFVTTPDFVLRTDLDENPDGYRQFPQSFLDALTPQLVSHFRETAAGQPAKAPSPLGVNITVELPDATTAEEQFVVRLYTHVLGRGISDADLGYWTGRLEGGASHLAVANAVATSAEARVRLVEQTYRELFDRGADASGRAYWTGRLAGGLPAEQLRAHLFASPEGVAKAGGTDPDLAAALYRSDLGRPGDPAGLAYWAGRMGGTTAGRHSTAVAFGRTDEVIATFTRNAVRVVCGREPVAGDPIDQLESIWARTGRNPQRVIAGTVALVCPDEGPGPR